MKKTSSKKSTTKIISEKNESTEKNMFPSLEPYIPTRSKKITPIGIGLAVLVLVGLTVFGFMKRDRDMMTNLKTKVIPTAVKAVLGDGASTIKEIKNLKKTNGVISFELDLLSGDQTQNYTSYITTDGKILFTAGVLVDELTKKAAAATPTPPKVATCTDVKATEKPVVTAFVVSQCPYGIQMQRAYSVAIGEQKDIAGFVDVRYIGEVVEGKITSMHGEKEAEENHRQICIREEQKEKYWPYVSCYMKAGDSQTCASSAGIDTAKVTACMGDANRGVAYAQKDFDISKKFGVTSSPTLLVNNEAIISENGFGGRTPDAVKSMICCASTNKPAFCSTELSKTAIATSYSETTAGTGTGSAANCGI